LRPAASAQASSCSRAGRKGSGQALRAVLRLAPAHPLGLGACAPKPAPWWPVRPPRGRPPPGAWCSLA
jgi:hypothetical protein